MLRDKYVIEWSSSSVDDLQQNHHILNVQLCLELYVVVLVL